MEEAANFVNAGFWRLKAPETCIWAPEGAFDPKRNFFCYLFTFFSAVSLYIWSLVGPNIAKKGWPLPQPQGVHRQTHFGTVDF